jgi:HD-like signal output (HDOD) protein
VNIKPGLLKPFAPFSDMPPEYVIVAAKFAQELNLRDGEVVLEKDSEDTNDYFLVDGGLELTDIYDQVSTIQAKTPHALKPLPQLRPSACGIKVSGQARLIRISQQVISRVKADAPEKETSVNEEALLDITQTREFFEDFKEELHLHHVRLPSLRSSASRALRITSNDDVSGEQIVEAIGADPGIAAKLLKMSNSSLFSAEGPVRDLPKAVERLSVSAAKEITACFAFRDVFKNMSPELNAMLNEQVQASRQVSAMAAIVAEMTDTVDPDVAALAGLLHNVGVLPVFGYATRNVAYAMNSHLVERAIERLSDQVGVLIAKKWRFGEEIISSLEEGSNWGYNPGEDCNLVSVILTAKYHFALSKNGFKGLPKPKDVPSLAAVSKGEFSEEFSFKILEGAKASV